MQGKTGTTRQNVNYIFAAIAILHVWMITGTINVKLASGTFCDIDTIQPKVLVFVATLVFLVLLLLVFTMKTIQIHTLNCFNDAGGLISKSSRNLQSSTSRLQEGINWFIVNTFSALSNSFDSLFDAGEDTRNELGNSASSQEHRADNALHRSIEKTRKSIKSELKGMLEQMTMSLREMEDQHKAQFAETQDLIIQLRQGILQEEEENNFDFVEDGSESNHNSSASSLSIGEIDKSK